MAKLKPLKGIVLVAAGACSYGVLATFVKYANNQGIGTGALIFGQYAVGVVLLSVLLFIKQSLTFAKQKTEKGSRRKLFFFGTTLGLTSSFYYLSIQFIPVSVAVVMLMQSIWMGVVLEVFTDRSRVGLWKILGALLAIGGTLLATKVFESEIQLDYRGMLYGALAAVSYTGTMYASNRVSLELTNLTRSTYLVYGGFAVILIFWNFSIIEQLNWSIFLTWGIFLSIFGCILPPILFNRGFPKIGTGVGSIVAAIEIPVSVYSAYLVLKEQITWIQWLGIMLILSAVALLNIKWKRQ